MRGPSCGTGVGRDDIWGRPKGSGARGGVVADAPWLELEPKWVPKKTNKHHVFARLDGKPVNSETRVYAPMNFE